MYEKMSRFDGMRNVLVDMAASEVWERQKKGRRDVYIAEPSRRRVLDCDVQESQGSEHMGEGEGDGRDDVGGCVNYGWCTQ